MRNQVTVLLIFMVLIFVGCKRESARSAGATRQVQAPAGPGEAAPASPSLFANPFPFQCSKEKKVGCTGVFPARLSRESGPRRSEAALPFTGQDALRARIETLKLAKKSIRIQALIFRGDESGLYIADLLKQKKKQGVKVQVIVDAASNLEWKTQWMYFDLKRHGIDVEGYEALYLHWITAEIKPSDPLRPNKRFHDKMWIVDAEDHAARVAIVGGLNIANEYFRVDSTPINRWTDQDIVLRGPIVGDVTRTFDRNFEFFKEIKRKRPRLLNPDNAWKLARKTLNKINKIKYPTWRKPALVASIKQVLQKPASLVYHPITGRFLQSRPRFSESYIQQAYLHLIQRAKKSVLIANAYFIPSRQLMEALKDAARRGVKVVVLTNSPETNDIQPVAVLSRFIYKKLLEVNREPAVKQRGGAGIAVHEWSGAPFSEGTLHAKYAVFDGKDAIVGSYNLDPRSERLNSETALAFRDDKLVAGLRTHFLSKLIPKSHKVTWDEALRYRRPGGIKKKFKLLFALPLREWL